MDAAWRDTHTEPGEDGFSSIVLEGKTYTDKKDAGSALLEIAHSMKSPDPIPLGTYRGFELTIWFDKVATAYVVDLKHELTHPVTLGSDVFGNLQRFDNALSRLEDSIASSERKLDNLRVQMSNAKEELGKPFPQEAELMQKSARLSELNVLLDLDHRENEIVDSDRDDSIPERKMLDRER